MKRSVSIAAVSLVCLSQSALADNAGVYFGAGLANGTLSACVKTSGSCGNDFSETSQDGAHLRLIGGYDFNKYIGIEAGLSQLGSYKVKNSLGQTTGTVKASAVTLAAKGGYTFPHGWSVFGKLGLASVNTKYTADPGWLLIGNADQSSGGVVVGAGGQYNFNETAGLRLFTEIVTFSDDGYTGAIGGTTLMAVFKF